MRSFFDCNICWHLLLVYVSHVIAAGAERGHPCRERVLDWRLARSCGRPICPCICRLSARPDSSSAHLGSARDLLDSVYSIPGRMARRSLWAGGRRAARSSRRWRSRATPPMRSASSWPLMFAGLLGVMAWKLVRFPRPSPSLETRSRPRAARRRSACSRSWRARAPGDQRAGRRRADREPGRNRGVRIALLAALDARG